MVPASVNIKFKFFIISSSENEKIYISFALVQTYLIFIWCNNTYKSTIISYQYITDGNYLLPAINNRQNLDTDYFIRLGYLVNTCFFMNYRTPYCPIRIVINC